MSVNSIYPTAGWVVPANLIVWSMTMTQITRKTATPATKATKATTATKALARKTATPAPKALDTVSETALLVQRCDRLERALVTLAKKVELCEAREAVYTGICDRFEKIIKGLTTPAPAPAPAPKALETATPAPKATKATTATPAPEALGYADLLSKALDAVIDGVSAGVWCPNLVAQCDYDLRFFIDSKTRAEIKAYVKADSSCTLKGFSSDLVALLESETDSKALELNPYTLVQALELRTENDGKTPAPVM